MSRPGGSAARAPLALRTLLAGLLLLPVVEIAVTVAVGYRIGAGRTVLLVLIGSAAGLWILRGVAGQALRALRAVRPGAGPGDGATTGGPLSPPGSADPAETALLLVAGGLLLFPGLVTDVLGLVLLPRRSRAVVLRRAGAALASRLGPVGARGGSRVRVLRGEAIDLQVVDPDAGRPGGTAGAPPPPGDDLDGQWPTPRP
jgi:UPF0716 protein FxsA